MRISILFSFIIYRFDIIASNVCVCVLKRMKMYVRIENSFGIDLI